MRYLEPRHCCTKFRNNVGSIPIHQISSVTHMAEDSNLIQSIRSVLRERRQTKCQHIQTPNLMPRLIGFALHNHENQAENSVLMYRKP